MESAYASGTAIARSIVTAIGTVFVTEIGMRDASVAINVIATLSGVTIAALQFVAAIDGGHADGNDQDDSWQDPTFLEALSPQAVHATLTEGQRLV